MSEEDEFDVAPSGSLESRMSQRRDEIERDPENTEIFPLPGKYGDIIAVELRAMGWKKMSSIAKALKRIQPEELRELYVACDQIAAATVGFHEITYNNGEPTYRRLVNESWVTVAGRVSRLGDNPTNRQGMLALIQPDSLIPIFHFEWQEWVRDVRPKIDQELSEDFSKTG